MGSHEYFLIFFSVISIISALGMVFLRNPISVALCLLGVLLSTAGIYGVIGEHLVATLQLIIYAGAIMVLFVFSIMLLNIDVEVKNKVQLWSTTPYVTVAVGLLIVCSLVSGVYYFTQLPEAYYSLGEWTQEKVIQSGGTSWLLSVEVMTKYFFLFELVGVALLIAAVGAVVLAKRKL